MKLHSSRKGFTLIELMVVIVIIGILATLGLVSYRNALIRSRDSKIMSDLKDIATAQEQFRAVGGISGAYVNLPRDASNNCTAGTIGTDFSIPFSPSSYPYKCYGDTTAFCVIAQMERAGNGNCTSCSCSSGSCTAPNASGTSSHYCVTSKQ